MQPNGKDLHRVAVPELPSIALAANNTQEAVVLASRPIPSLDLETLGSRHRFETELCHSIPGNPPRKRSHLH